MGLGVAGFILARQMEPYLRAQIVATLSSRLHARVELDVFHVHFDTGQHNQWGIVAEGRGLRVWPSVFAPAGASPAPLIVIDAFSFHAPLRYRRSQPIVISTVRLSGLSVRVPPRSRRAVTPPSQGPPATSAQAVLASVIVQQILCERAQLILETDKPNKLPLGFAIQHLRLTHIAAAQPISYEVQVTLPRPKGTVHATGNFGPWNADDPGSSAISGAYTFANADLGVFKGIAGTLNSAGQFQGALAQISVQGETDTPNFAITHFNSPVALHTAFQARVDGADGDTWLDSVRATLGNAHFLTHGQIVRLRTPDSDQEDAALPEALRDSPLQGGHDIQLDVALERTPIDDVLRLANSAQKPLLTGVVSVKAKLHIPPGKQPVVQRIALAGSFQLDQAQFTNPAIQSKVEELSLRGQGKPGEAKSAQPIAISSQMQSSFTLANAVVTLPDLQYNVPGAEIQLHGAYALSGALNFQGVARMDATISQMVGGWKGLLLKPADRFFKKDGAGTQVPIHVSGTRDAPHFGVDFGRLNSTHPQNPANPQGPAGAPAPIPQG